MLGIAYVYRKICLIIKRRKKKARTKEEKERSKPCSLENLIIILKKAVWATKMYRDRIPALQQTILEQMPGGNPRQIMAILSQNFNQEMSEIRAQMFQELKVSEEGVRQATQNYATEPQVDELLTNLQELETDLQGMGIDVGSGEGGEFGLMDGDPMDDEGMMEGLQDYNGISLEEICKIFSKLMDRMIPAMENAVQHVKSMPPLEPREENKILVELYRVGVEKAKQDLLREFSLDESQFERALQFHGREGALIKIANDKQAIQKSKFDQLRADLQEFRRQRDGS